MAPSDNFEDVSAEEFAFDDEMDLSFAREVQLDMDCTEDDFADFTDDDFYESDIEVADHFEDDLDLMNFDDDYEFDDFMDVGL